MSRPPAAYRIIAYASRPLVRSLFRLEARGLENLPSGGFVLAANHLSNLDPWPVGLPLFPVRWLRFMAKAELYWWPLSLVLDAGGAFKVRRGESDGEAISAAIELVRDGYAVVMFPEGTRRRKGVRKRHEARWRSGAARIALTARVPLVPAGISGTERLARLGPLRVAFGAPIATDDLSELQLTEAARVATERLRDAITELERGLV
jgi:1-acyl-sn-glycerol-3-phosphate acyltransferase